eukprot:654889_1
MSSDDGRILYIECDGDIVAFAFVIEKSQVHGHLSGIPSTHVWLCASHPIYVRRGLMRRLFDAAQAAGWVTAATYPGTYPAMQKFLDAEGFRCFWEESVGGRRKMYFAKQIISNVPPGHSPYSWHVSRDCDTVPPGHTRFSWFGESKQKWSLYAEDERASTPTSSGPPRAVGTPRAAGHPRAVDHPRAVGLSRAVGHPRAVGPPRAVGLSRAVDRTQPVARASKKYTRPPGTRRFRATVAYDGTEFFGWQLQCAGPVPSVNSGTRLTVQGALEARLSSFFRRQIRVAGSGRTDAGVHARGQVFTFDAPWTQPASVLASRLA